MTGEPRAQARRAPCCRPAEFSGAADCLDRVGPVTTADGDAADGHPLSLVSANPRRTDRPLTALATRHADP